MFGSPRGHPTGLRTYNLWWENNDVNQSSDNRISICIFEILIDLPFHDVRTRCGTDVNFFFFPAAYIIYIDKAKTKYCIVYTLFIYVFFNMHPRCIASTASETNFPSVLRKSQLHIKTMSLLDLFITLLLSVFVPKTAWGMSWLKNTKHPDQHSPPPILGTTILQTHLSSP